MDGSGLEDTPGGWSKQRIIFLSIAGAVVGLLLFLVRGVLLPFVLAITIAYVLTPLVAFAERRRFPRSLAIISVYVVVLGSTYLLAAGIAPRIYSESVQIARDAPQMLKTAAYQHGPRIEAFVNDYLDKKDRDAPEDYEPAIVVQPNEDGSLNVDMQRGFEIIEESPGHYLVRAPEELPADGVRVATLVNQGIEQFIKYVELNAFHFLKLGQSLVTGLARGIFLLFMTLMVAGYLMHTREAVLDFFGSLLPAHSKAGFQLFLKRLDRGLAGVIRGQLVICAVNGLLSAVGFALLGLNYWPLLALVAAVMSIIPIFGSILSTIPAVLIGLTQDVWTSLWVLLWILGIHQIEANFLNPKIIGDSAKIHPVLVVFSLLVGEHFFGLWGALLAVPLLSVAHSIFNHFRYLLPHAPRDSLVMPLPEKTIEKVP